jgi:hypothetical protein
MGGENLSLHTPCVHCSATNPPWGGTRRVSYPKFPGLGLIHSPSTHLDPASTNHRSTKEQGPHATRPGVLSPSHPLRHHGVQGWPAIPGARRFSGFHSARQNFTSKAPPASLSSLDPIKGKAGDSTKKRRKRQETSHHPTTEDQHLKQSPMYSLFKTWDRLPLSQLITPTQALRCKEIQYFPPLDVGPFLARTRINSPCILFASPSRLRTRSTNSLIGLGPSWTRTPTLF